MGWHKTAFLYSPNLPDPVLVCQCYSQLPYVILCWMLENVMCMNHIFWTRCYIYRKEATVNFGGIPYD